LKSVRASAFDFENPESKDAPIHVCGRYFSTKDPRYAYHPLSLRLINAKASPERHAGLVARILTFWLRATNAGAVVMCAVPPRPGEAENVIGQALPLVTGKQVTAQQDLIQCVGAYPKQKEIGAPDARRANVRGAFKVREGLRGERVVVVDDITTSFSTLNEARERLIEAGAGQVVPIAIEFHPPKLSDGPSFQYPKCGSCKNQMIVRFRKNGGGPFFACPDIEKYRLGEPHPPIDFRAAYESAVRTGG